MCNHYRAAQRKGAIIPGWSEEFSELKIPLRFDNIMPEDVWPDREGLVVRLEAGKPLLDLMRWGFPPPPFAKPPRDVTNLRHPDKAYWRPYLGVEHRCLVPVERFAEPDPEKPKPRAERWFASPDDAPLFFAGIWRDFDGDRGPKSKPVPGPHKLFAFLTTEPNSVVAPIHSKAMPVVLAPQDAMTWLAAPIPDALKLQKPAPDNAVVLLPRLAA